MKRIINWIISIFNKPQRNFGITKYDIQTNAQSNSVSQQKEAVVSIAYPTFKGVNGDGSIRQFPYMYQDGDSGCVSFSAGKIAMIINYLIRGVITIFSAGWFYTQRSNKNDPVYPQGMIFDNLVGIASTKGCLPDSYMPSFGLSETAINSLQITNQDIEIASQYKLPPNWINVDMLDDGSFEAVASSIEITKKPMMLWFKFGPGEFFYTNYPTAVNSNNPWVHSTVATDTTTINGVNYIVIEESADSINFFRKYITKEFFIAKCILARYPITFQFNEIPNKPVFDGSIESAQSCLQYLKYFPSNIAPTGYWGSISTAACSKFQVANGITPSVGILGDITKAKLLSLFN